MDMTQEDKNLLVRDICARLPYGVIAHASEINKNGIITDVNILYSMVNLTVDNASGKYEPVPLSDIKPYLRPLSSITEEERNEYFDVKMQECERVALAEVYRPEAISIIMDWLNSRHLDYRGLIEKGLALEAPERMYKKLYNHDNN